MGKPSARITDSCAHGGKIVTGEVTVIVGGRPAARIMDNHVCPAVCPGPAPHVGGPIIPPCAVNVIIGGRPAARIGDKAICACAIDSIVSGEATVLIGTSSAGMPVVPSRIPAHPSVQRQGPAAGPTVPAGRVGGPTGGAGGKLASAGIAAVFTAPAGSTAQQLAGGLAEQVRQSVPARKRPMVTAAAVDRRTGKVYAGVSGKPYPPPHEALKARVEARRGAGDPIWDPCNCAEFQAVNAALHGGARLENIEVAAVVTKSGKPKERCGHCKQTTAGTTCATDALVGATDLPPAAPTAAQADEGPTPGRPGTFHRQEQTLSCGVASCRMVIENMTQEDWPEATLRNQAQQRCGFSETMGAKLGDLTGLLEAHGVQCSYSPNMSVDDVARNADSTHPVIVDVGGHAIVVDRVIPGPDGQRIFAVRDPFNGPGHLEEWKFREVFQQQGITTSKW